MSAPLYTRDILRLAASIPHLRRLDGAQASVEKRAPVCGSRVFVEIALDEAGRAAALGQEVKACALGQASAALMGRHAIGRSADEFAAGRDALAAFLAGRSDDPGDWPGIEALAVARNYPARHGAILLPFEAVAEAAAQAASLAAAAP
ncbi:iron-sulfur cluster assembly scaffold protein [Sphingosinicella sp.]|uniref:iron-sulfur cluster assembly scaffold protein n=1 Tax=Sphingosinicella sp. TaxID=1917971 RepID=UPI0040379C36